jgi:hypothetical protein
VQQEGKKVRICVDARKFNQYTVTCIPIARQRVGKHIPAKANAHKNRTSIDRKWISKHASLAIEAVFSVWSVQSYYKEVFSSIELVVKNWVELWRWQSKVIENK